jgi:glycosyltransferase involved in cell wall biosynthesis
MKVGLLITTFNRPEYLAHCLYSIKEIDVKDELIILIVDDKSTNQETIEMIQDFHFEKATVRKMYLTKNQGISHSLRTGFNYLFSCDCDIVINLDADTIVKQEFLTRLIYLKKQFPEHIVSGFNTQTVDPKTAKIRHRTISQHEGYCIKSSIGGINMVIDVVQYTEKILPALKSPNHWDWNVCSLVKQFIVSTPSLVQHIGLETGIHKNNPDVAFDF